MHAIRCEHCGATFPPPSSYPWPCHYCGTPAALPEEAEDEPARVPLTDDGVLGHLRRTVTGLGSTWLHPSLPPKKLANVRKAHAAHLPGHEVVLAIYDGAAFGSASDGFVVTAKRLCWKNIMEPAHSLEWVHLDEGSVDIEDTTLRIGQAKIYTLYKKHDDALYAWADALQTFARSARPPPRRPRAPLPQQPAPRAKAPSPAHSPAVPGYGQGPGHVPAFGYGPPNVGHGQTPPAWPGAPAFPWPPPGQVHAAPRPARCWYCRYAVDPRGPQCRTCGARAPAEGWPPA